MNKAKINELYEQAHVVYEIPYEASVVEPGNIAIHKQKVWDRYLFAELIVRECIKSTLSLQTAAVEHQWSTEETFHVIVDTIAENLNMQHIFRS